MSEISITAQDLNLPVTVTERDEVEEPGVLRTMWDTKLGFFDQDLSKQIPRWKQYAKGIQGLNRSPMLDRLWAAMPPEIRDNKSIKNNIDIRAIAQRVLDSADETGAIVNGISFSKAEVTALSRETGWITVGLRDDLAEDLRKMYPKGDDEANDEYKTRIDIAAMEMSREYLDGEAKPLPERLDVEKINVNAEGLLEAGPGASESTQSSTNIFGELESDSEGAVTTKSFLTRQEVQALIQEGGSLLDGFERLRADEAQMTALAESGTENVNGEVSRVTYRDGLPKQQMTGTIGMGDSGTFDRFQGKETYTLSEVLRMPSDMTTQEVMMLSEKLEDGGFFQMAGGKPVMAGDSTDQQFKTAWRLLVAMSLEKGESMTSLLGSQISKYETAMQEQITTQLSDPASVQLKADALGRDILGRKMTQEEHLKLTEFVHTLERRNSMTAAGLDPDTDMPGVEQLDEGVMADIDAQMEQYVRRENPLEAEGNDVAETYEVFSGMLAGPGRGFGGR